MPTFLSNKLEQAANNKMCLSDSTIKKRRFYVSTCFALIYVIGTLFILSLIARCSSQQASAHHVKLSHIHIAAAEKAARKFFSKGDWYFRGSQVESEILNLYIEIPRPLELSLFHQQNYIAQSICPKLGNPLWNKVNASQVRVHLISDWVKFTATKDSSVSSLCG